MKFTGTLTSLVILALAGGGALFSLTTAQAHDVIHKEKSARHPVHGDKVIVIRKPHRAHVVPRHRHRVLRKRHYRGIRVLRPYGHSYLGYGFFSTDDDAYKWLAFTAITLKILDNINEEQQRMHEAAQVRAATARVGETIVWEEGDASGSVRVVRQGTSTSGRQCREFQHSVTIGGRTEQAYGIACRQPDGAWEIVH